MSNWFLDTLSHILVHHSTMTYSFHSISIKCFVFCCYNCRCCCCCCRYCCICLCIQSVIRLSYLVRVDLKMGHLQLLQSAIHRIIHGNVYIYFWLDRANESKLLLHHSICVDHRLSTWNIQKENSYFCLFTFLIWILFLFTQQWSGRWWNSIVSIK